MISKLDWDTDFFGYPVGKAYYKPQDVFDEQFFLEKAKTFKLVYVFSEKPLILKKSLLKLVDIKVTFCKHLEKGLYINHKQNCFPYTYNSKDYNSIETLALESGKHSRYRTDRSFKNNEFEKLYKKWALESIKRAIANEVFVFHKKEQIAGFVTIVINSNSVAQIGLIGVSPVSQGLGIGRVLLSDAERFAISQKCGSMQIVTQYNNKKAVSFYEKHGYSRLKKAFIYHFWKKK